MKKIIYLFIAVSIIVNFGACKKESSNYNNSANAQKLTSHSWSSYKVINTGVDITSSTGTLSYSFNTDGTFSATSPYTSGPDRWSLTDATLNMASGGTWTVLLLTQTDLQIKNSTGDIFIYMH